MHSILEKNNPWLILSILYDPLILFLIINLISEVLPRHRNATLHHAIFRPTKCSLFKTLQLALRQAGPFEEAIRPILRYYSCQPLQRPHS